MVQGKVTQSYIHRTVNTAIIRDRFVVWVCLLVKLLVKSIMTSNSCGLSLFCVMVKFPTQIQAHDAV